MPKTNQPTESDNQEPSVNPAEVFLKTLPTGLSTEQLLIGVLSRLSEGQQQLAEAILESRKPYVSPEAERNKAERLVQHQKAVEMTLKGRQDAKRLCGHRRENGTLNIHWHEHSNGITMGVCGTCMSQFDTRDAADAALLRSDPFSIQNMGRAGAHARTHAF